MGIKCYYAHPVSLYGTKQEENDILDLKWMGFDVINPGTPEHAYAYNERGMVHFFDVIDECNMVAFRSFMDGSIPAGVAAEVQYAQKNHKPIIELPSNFGRRVLTVDVTRSILKELGAR